MSQRSMIEGGDAGAVRKVSAEHVVRGRLGLSGVEKLRRLKEAYGGLGGVALLRAVAAGEFPGRAAVASSFGAESAVLLALVAEVDRAMPVLFLETGMLFPETLAYVDTLVARLGLTDVRRLRPEPGQLAAADPEDELWMGDPDKCCYIRKVRPFRVARREFDCWVSGLKRAHGGARGDVEPIELEEGQIKLNPLALWSAADIDAAFVAYGLPRHPLVARGYRSIGCIPCTRVARPGEDPRAGRWEGRGKTECGIHSRLHAATGAGGVAAEAGDGED
jgi:phosphoadenosine phosphosulfate reductase